MQCRLKLLFLFSIVVVCSFYASAQSFKHAESWEIRDNELILNDTETDALANKYWLYLNKILPTEVLAKYVRSLKLFSDGEQEELGGMAAMNDLNTEWEIDIDTIDFNFYNPDSAYVLDYVHTIIHEFGHLLSLNADQINVTEDTYQDDAMGYLTSEGYADNNSYLGQYVKQFWAKNLLEEWDDLDRIKRENRKIKLLFEFYLEYDLQFLTSYAAESPEEDFSEAWTFFILSDKPVLGSVKHQKVSFFYQFPELIKYREEIRVKLDFIPEQYVKNFKPRGEILNSD